MERWQESLSGFIPPLVDVYKRQHPNTATVEWGQEMVQTTADYILDLIEELKKVSL